MTSRPSRGFNLSISTEYTPKASGMALRCLARECHNLCGLPLTTPVPTFIPGRTRVRCGANPVEHRSRCYRQLGAVSGRSVEVNRIGQCGPQNGRLRFVKDPGAEFSEFLSKPRLGAPATGRQRRA